MLPEELWWVLIKQILISLSAKQAARKHIGLPFLKCQLILIL